ncbi:MAG: methyltransferase domain-containing protein [Sphingomonas sp.]|uniref:class I SAM-dependent methyltransferase n=1 Tax=Sphingomonas sp. TaxID=28214 RepID=UPI001833BDC2|nr:methyltransferase domain-containing protein [Sphingomonas sp.]MBA3667430.1 methyltransferase domain-containing protein [Sphingomonas sp.]
MASIKLVCPAHGGPLHEDNGQLKSDRGDIYPVVGGVAVVVQGVKVQPRTEPLAPSVIDQLLDALCLHQSRRAVLERAFNQKFSFVEDWIQTEADQFLGRVAASHEGLHRALKMGQEKAEVPIPINVAPSARISSIFNISRLVRGTCCSVNVRVHNDGASTLSSNGANPFLLSYRWIDARGVEYEGKRTELFDDLLPGRSVTLPVFIDTPAKTGSYKLRIRALQEDVSWFEQTSVIFKVKIGWWRATVHDPKWKRTGRQFDYMEDHYEAVRLLAEWRDTLFDRPVEHVLELGGNANPMIDHLDAPHKYNVDVDPYGMIVGKLIREGTDSDVEFIVADGMALPLPRRSIDMLVLFATFHHFPDPIGLLSHLRDFVTDDGLICLMCEPIGHVHLETLNPEYLKELGKGVNEQSFELWEYQQMFDAAKLDVVAVQVDVGSIKVALRPRNR